MPLWDRAGWLAVPAWDSFDPRPALLLGSCPYLAECLGLAQTGGEVSRPMHLLGAHLTAPLGMNEHEIRRPATIRACAVSLDPVTPWLMGTIFHAFSRLEGRNLLSGLHPAARYPQAARSRSEHLLSNSWGI